MVYKILQWTNPKQLCEFNLDCGNDFLICAINNYDKVWMSLQSFQCYHLSLQKKLHLVRHVYDDLYVVMSRLCEVNLPVYPIHMIRTVLMVYRILQWTGLKQLCQCNLDCGNHFLICAVFMMRCECNCKFSSVLSLKKKKKKMHRKLYFAFGSESG